MAQEPSARLAKLPKDVKAALEARGLPSIPEDEEMAGGGRGAKTKGEGRGEAGGEAGRWDEREMVGRGWGDGGGGFEGGREVKDVEVDVGEEGVGGGDGVWKRVGKPPQVDIGREASPRRDDNGWGAEHEQEDDEAAWEGDFREVVDDEESVAGGGGEESKVSDQDMDLLADRFGGGEMHHKKNTLINSGRLQLFSRHTLANFNHNPFVNLHQPSTSQFAKVLRPVSSRQRKCEVVKRLYLAGHFVFKLPAFLSSTSTGPFAARL